MNRDVAVKHLSEIEEFQRKLKSVSRKTSRKSFLEPLEILLLTQTWFIASAQTIRVHK